MTSEKNEAQLRNEAEVKRIMAERGYSSPSHKKKIKKTLGRNFSFKPFIIGIIIIGLIVGGWFFLQNNPFKINQDDSQFNEQASTDSNQEYADFYTCLGGIDTSEITLDDVDFWNKHIVRYEQTISCYDKYPSAADASEKAELEERLSELRENSQNAEANNLEYRSNMAQIDAELAQNLAKIKEEGDAWDAELTKRVQERQAESDARQAEYAKQQAEHKEKQARCDAFKAQYPSADDYKAKNGNLDELWNNYQAAKADYEHWIRIAYSGTASSERYREENERTVRIKESIMNSAHDAWSSAITRLNNEYNAKYREACL